MTETVFVEKFNKILLSQNVFDSFYSNYKGEFAGKLNALIPEVEQCKAQQQNTPWHIYNVLDHILHSVEYINKQTSALSENKRLKLATVMFFHDLGKPKCHGIKIVDGEERDHFKNHNIESLEIFKRVSSVLDFSQSTFREICFLIEKHDIFCDFVLESPKDYEILLNKENVQNFLNSVPKEIDNIEIAKELVMVGKADNYAQNREMSNKTLKVIERFEEILNELC